MVFIFFFPVSNDYSRVVGEEYLKFFDFTGQTLDQALRLDSPAVTFSNPNTSQSNFCFLSLSSDLSWRSWCWSERARRGSECWSISPAASITATPTPSPPQVSISHCSTFLDSCSKRHQSLTVACVAVVFMTILRGCVGFDVCVDAAQHRLARTGEICLSERCVLT